MLIWRYEVVHLRAGNSSLGQTSTEKSVKDTRLNIKLNTDEVKEIHKFLTIYIKIKDSVAGGMNGSYALGIVECERHTCGL